jgi:hypothetical protein
MFFGANKNDKSVLPDIGKTDPLARGKWRESCSAGTRGERRGVWQRRERRPLLLVAFLHSESWFDPPHEGSHPRRGTLETLREDNRQFLLPVMPVPEAARA